MVTDALTNVLGIVCLQAIFSKKEWAHPGTPLWTTIKAKVSPEWDSQERRVAHPYEFIRELMEAMYTPDLKAFGFKHHLTLDSGITKLLMNNAAFTKFVLRRDNLLAAYSSNKIAKITGQGVARVGEEVRTATCRFDQLEFEAFCRRRRKAVTRWDDEFRPSARGQVVDINYTDLRREGGFAPILSALGYKPMTPITIGTLQRSTSNIIERFENPDAAERHLRDTGQIEWLKEE